MIRSSRLSRLSRLSRSFRSFRSYRLSRWRRRATLLLGEERGQVLPLVATCLMLIMGLTALSIDGGRAYAAWRALQSATDAEALAAAQSMQLANAPSDVYAAALKYSATTGNLNANPILTNVASPQPVLECLNTLVTQNQYCVGPVPYNAVKVTQTATIPMYFAGIFGKSTMPMTAISTAAAHGGVPRYANVAVIMDTSLSMGQVDSNCGNVTQMACALGGVAVLLQYIAPCPVISGNCTQSSTPGQVQDSIQRISMFAFPNVSTTTASVDSNCTVSVPTPTNQNNYWGPTATFLNSSGVPFVANVGNFVMPFAPTPPYGNVGPWSGVPTALPYSFPSASATSYNPGSGSTVPTYQITGWLSDYRSSATTANLATSSDIVQTSANLGGCGAMQPPNYTGQYGTYYAGAIYAAQASLLAQQAKYPGSTNVIILLSDGDATTQQTSNGINNMPGANASGLYPSWNGECGQAVDAGKNATSAGTQVYTIAYGSPTSGCVSDLVAGTHPGITPCQTMATIATSSHFFYSDFNQSGSYSTCTTSYPSVTLSAIFKTIAVDLTVPRLIPITWT